MTDVGRVTFGPSMIRQPQKPVDLEKLIREQYGETNMSKRVCRAKFKVDGVENHVPYKRWVKNDQEPAGGHLVQEAGHQTVRFNAVGADGVDENERYHRYTPSGSLKIRIDNEALRDAFQPGHEYYIDFTRADA